MSARVASPHAACERSAEKGRLAGRPGEPAMSDDRAWAAALRSACEHPEEAAAPWRASGGQVVGLLGWSAPRELVTAAGMLPVRLSPERLAGLDPDRRNGPEWPDAVAAFGSELTPATARLAATLLSGALDWVDFLVIGRDREDYTRLFYLLRELRRDGAAPRLIPVAFFDLLRLPSRTSARYNRQRAADLAAVIAGWAGRPATPADLTGTVEAAGEIACSFRGIQELRGRPHPCITGTDALAAAIASRVLPAAELLPLLDAVLAAAPTDVVSPGVRAPRARVFLAGSAVDDLNAYEALESLGLAIVGEDHEWSDDGSEYPLATRDPLDGIVDRYHFAHGGVARAGLRDRTEGTARRVRATLADGVLYLLGPRDEAAGWELPALRDRLGAIPLIPVRLHDQARRPAVLREPARADQGLATDGAWPELRDAGRRLLAELGAVSATSGAAEARHG